LPKFSDQSHKLDNSNAVLFLSASLIPESVKPFAHYQGGLMTQQKFKLNHQPGMAKKRSSSLRTKLFKRVVIPAVLLGGLALGTSERSVVKVQADDDCNLNSIALEECYFPCAYISDPEAKRLCYADCELAHSLRGVSCSFPSHSPMMITGGGCDPATNGQRAYDNCIAGTLSGFWLEQYLIYMAYYDDEEISCQLIGQGVEAQGCY
jgi:hypothetical protein